MRTGTARRVLFSAAACAAAACAAAAALLASTSGAAALFPDPELLDLTWNAEGEVPAMPINEKNALVDIWRSTAGTHWRNTWDLRSDPCASGWYGVSCSTEGHVLEIDLTANGLIGYLPRTLGQLAHLQKLILTDNKLTGPIPSSLSKLTEIVELDLTHNRLTGEIPLYIANFNYLERLHLAKNDFSSTSLDPSIRRMEERGVNIWTDYEL